MADEPLPPIDESVRRRFESSWKRQVVEDIAKFLPAPQSACFAPTLETLIHIDLELAWVRTPMAPPRPLEEYITAFPQLAEDAQKRLAVFEHDLRVRQSHAPMKEERLRRFPALLCERNGFPDLSTRTLPKTAVERATAPHLPGYEILERLGQGGMGIVYKARSFASDRPVAIKVMKAFSPRDMTQLARFRVEAEAVACLRHKNIVPVLEIGLSGGHPFLVLEFVPGGDLKSVMRSKTSDPVWSASVAAGVARGLHHSHRLGVLHRDLKPQNILMDADGTPRITDFGLAKFTVSGESRERLRSESILPGIYGSLMQLNEAKVEDDLQGRIATAAKQAMSECGAQYAQTITINVVTEFVKDAVQDCDSKDAPRLDYELTRHGDVLGTPAYMAPEQTIGDVASYGPPTDIYSLGVVLYESLCGKVPFKDDSVSVLFQKIRNESPPPFRPGVPSALAAICTRCLAKEVDERFSSAAQLAEELERFVDSANVRLSSDKRWWQLWR